MPPKEFSCRRKAPAYPPDCLAAEFACDRMLQFECNQTPRFKVLPRRIGRHERHAQSRRRNGLGSREKIAAVRRRQVQPLCPNDGVEILLGAEALGHEDKPLIAQLFKADAPLTRQRMARTDKRTELRRPKGPGTYGGIPAGAGAQA